MDYDSLDFEAARAASKAAWDEAVATGNPDKFIEAGRCYSRCRVLAGDAEGNTCRQNGDGTIELVT